MSIPNNGGGGGGGGEKREKWDFVITDIDLHRTKAIILNRLRMIKQGEEKRECIQRRTKDKQMQCKVSFRKNWTKANMSVN